MNNSVDTFQSRSIQNLDIEIAQCKNNEKRLLLFAKKAGCLARHAYIAEAKSTLKELRLLNSEYDPKLSGWIIFAEGLVEHFDRLDNTKSKNKFARALLLGQMANDTELAGAASAWMAFCEMIAGDIQAAIDHVIAAFEWSSPNSGEARGRASMVLADTFNWAGDTKAAKTWYKEARNHAIRDGDIAMQNVMLFNLAAFNVANLTFADCVTPAKSEDLGYIHLEVSSANNLNAALGIQTLSSLGPTMLAELNVVQRKWQDAITLFNSNIEEIEKDGQARIVPKLIAQRAWCKANFGDLAGAREDVDLAMSKIADCSDVDDLAVLHSRIAAAGKLLGDKVIESENSKLAFEFIAKFREQQGITKGILDAAMPRLLQALKNPT